MPDYDLTRKSRPIIISDYQPRWLDEFREVGRIIRTIVGTSAVRIDHIGSTSVPGLAAKDVIDLQITVANLDTPDRVTVRLREAGFRQGTELVYDEFRTMSPNDAGLRKIYMREP